MRAEGEPDPQIRAACQGEAGAGAGALDGRDHRGPDHLQGGEEPIALGLVVECLLLCLEGLELANVGARYERRGAAGEDHAAD